MTTEEISALVRKQAEEARPDLISGPCTHSFASERRAFIAGRLPVLTALVEARRFLGHRQGCNKWIIDDCGWHEVLNGLRGCTCGYDQALATIDALMK